MRPNGAVREPLPLPPTATNHSAAWAGRAARLLPAAAIARTSQIRACPSRGGEQAMTRSAKRVGAIVLAIVVLLVGGAVLLPDAGTALVVSQPVDNPDAIVSLASHEWERLPEA